MPDQNPDTQDLQQEQPLQEPPPTGDPAAAQKYIDQLVELINNDKLKVSHTDLKKFDPSSLEDHYRVSLNHYQIEVSHSKQPQSGKDYHVILFTNLNKVKEGSSDKVILAYMYLSQEQFSKFRMVAKDQLERIAKEEEEKRLKEAIAPIDQILDEMGGNHPVEDLPQTLN